MHPESKTIWNYLRNSAKKRNLEFNLTLSYINNLSFPITCPILGIKLEWHKGKSEDNSYSFDRIDSSKGYVIDNIQIISMKANRAKNNLSAKELTLFSNYFK